MATRVPNTSTPSLTTASHWDQVTNTPTIHASTSITVTSGGIFSAAFTANSTSDQSTGVFIPFTAIGTAGNLVATLQEFDGVSTWTDKATQTIAITSLVANTKVYFRWSAAYTFTTTAASRYRIKLNTSGASGTTTVAADSGGSNFAYAEVDNRHTAPTTGDNILAAALNQSGSVVIDVDGSVSFGAGSDTAVPVFRSWGSAIDLYNNAVFKYPTSTSRTITLKGNIFEGPNGGEFRAGTVADPLLSTTRSALVFDQNGTTLNYGIGHVATGKQSIVSQAFTYRETTVVSGVGTAASPLITADTTGWTVGDELCFVPISDNAANYDEMETRFIISISTTSITLSTTSGGAEAALTYTHTGAKVINLTQPFTIRTTNTAQAWYGNWNETSSASSVKHSGVRFETFGGSTTGKTTLNFSDLATEMFEMDNVVFYRSLGTQGVSMGNNRDTRTYTWLVFYDHNGTGNAGAFFISSLQNKTFQHCRVVDSQSSGFFLSTASTCTFDDCIAWACGRASSTAAGGFFFVNATNDTLIDCESHANRSYGVQFNSASRIKAYDFLCGSKGENKSADIFVTSGTFQDVLFSNSLFDSTTFISGETGMNNGSEIVFDQYNQTLNDHRWYTPQGKFRSTGAGLSDTTRRTNTNRPNSLNLKGEPTDATTGLSFTYKVPAEVESNVQTNGFITKNSAMAADEITVELYLPGLTPGIDSPSDSYTMPTNTSTNPYGLTAFYTGEDDNRNAIVRVVAKSVSVGAAFYVADINGGTNTYTALETWDDGKPSEVMFPQLGDPNAVWAVLTASQTTPGTMGYLVTKLLTFVKFLGLRK